MSYKEKYLKYKLKYLNFKDKLYGGNQVERSSAQTRTDFASSGERRITRPLRQEEEAIYTEQHILEPQKH